MLDALTRPFGWRLPSLLVKVASYIFVGGALMLYINYPTLQEYFRARARRESYRESVAALKKEYDKLLREQSELKNGGFETEKTIRERLMMVKPGERILFIDPPAGEEDAPVRPALPRIPDQLKESLAPKEAPDAKRILTPPAAEDAATEAAPAEKPAEAPQP
jgi:hypothetical protein